LGYSSTKHFATTEQGLVEVPAPTTIPYASVDEFLALNDKCCFVGFKDPEGPARPTFATLVFGTYSDNVVATYAKRFVDSNGVQTEAMAISNVQLDVCGNVVGQ